MSYKIPSEENVIKIIIDLIKKDRIIYSQQIFKKKVEDCLTKIDNEYKISRKRVRLLAIKSNVIKLKIETKTNKMIDKLILCPVCGSKVTPIRSKTVYNWEITVGYECKICSYWTGKKKQIPRRYIFMLK